MLNRSIRGSKVVRLQPSCAAAPRGLPITRFGVLQHHEDGKVEPLGDLRARQGERVLPLGEVGGRHLMP
jgi:hypothetical protein